MQNDEDLNLPEGMRDALKRTYGHRAGVPADLDRAILGRASAKMNQRRRMRLMVRWGSGVAAAIAACIAIVAWVGPRTSGRPEMAAMARNESAALAQRPQGAIDMVHVMLLARQVRAGQAIDRSWDFDGNGTVDSADVENAAHEAVRLTQRVAGMQRMEREGGLQAPSAVAAHALALPSLRSLELPAYLSRRPTAAEAATLNYALVHPTLEGRP